MSEMKQRLPSKWARIPAAACALLLTALLVATFFSTLGIQIMTSRNLHERVALAGDVVERQMERIAEEVKYLAAEYGFDPEDILPLIERENVEQLDREIVRWWTDIASTGRLTEEPTFALMGADETLKADNGFTERLDSMMVQATVDLVISRVNTAVQKSTVLFRTLLVETAFWLAGDDISIPEIVKLLRTVPWIAGFGALAAAGMIALLMSRRIRTAGQYLGGALCASGLLTIFAMLLLKLLRIREMIAEASAALERQYVHLARILSIEMLAGAALMLILGVLLMAMARKEYGKA